MGKPLGPLINQLQVKVEANLQALQAAEKERVARERSERAATIASEHSAALHAVAEAVLRPHRPAHGDAADPPQRAGAGSPGRGPDTVAAAGTAADVAEQCVQLLMPLHLAVPQLPPPPPATVTGGVQLSWDPAGAVRLHAAPMPPDMSSDGFRAKLRRFIEQSAFLLPRIQNAAPDAMASANALQAARQELLEYFALMAVGRTPTEAPTTSGSPHPSGSSSSGGTLGSGSGSGTDSRGGAISPMVEVVMSALDGSAAPLPDRTHWNWAVEQMGLSDEKTALLSALLNAWHARRIAIAQRREALLAPLGAAAPAAAAATATSAATSVPTQSTAAATTTSGAAAPAGPLASVVAPAGGGSAPPAVAADKAAGHEGPVDLIKDLAAVQRSVEINTAVYFLSIYGTALDAEHVAALALGSWPFVPSLHALHEIVCTPARPAEGSSSGGTSDGGGAAVEGPGRRASARSRRGGR